MLRKPSISTGIAKKRKLFYSIPSIIEVCNHLFRLKISLQLTPESNKYLFFFLKKQNKTKQKVEYKWWINKTKFSSLFSSWENQTQDKNKQSREKKMIWFYSFNN